MVVDGNITARLVVCAHARKALMRPTTTNWPPAAIVCADCGQALITIDQARQFVAAAEGGK